MKHLVKLSLFSMAAVLFVSCGNNNEKAAVNEKQHDHETLQNNEKTSQTGNVRLNDDRLNAVYQHYIHLTTALTNSDVAEAKAAANAIEAGAGELQNGGAIAASASKITAASAIDAQRAAYEDLSMQMMERVKNTGLQSGEVFVQHCPMAFNDKGASWLSTSKEIRNPYFGEKMLTCGETKETIK